MRICLLLLMCWLLGGAAQAREFQFDAIVHDTLPGAVLVDTIGGSTLLPRPGVRLSGPVTPGRGVGVTVPGGEVLALTPSQALIKTPNGVVAVPRGLIGTADGRLSDVFAGLPTWLPVNSTLGVPLARLENRWLVQTLEDSTIRLRAMEGQDLALGRPVLLSMADGRVLARAWEPGLNSQIRFSGKVQQVTPRGVQLQTKAGTVTVPTAASYSYGSGGPVAPARLAPGQDVAVRWPIQEANFMGLEGPVAWFDDGYSVPATALPPYYAAAPVLMPVGNQMTTLPLGAALSYQVTPDLTLGLGTPGFHPSTIVQQQAFPPPLAAMPVDVRLRNGELVSLPFADALDVYRWQRGVLVQPPALAPEYASFPVGFVAPQGTVYSLPLQTALQLQCGQSAWFQSGDLSGLASLPVPVMLPGGRSLEVPLPYALRMERGRRAVIVEDQLPDAYADRLCQMRFANGAVVALPWRQALAQRRQRVRLAPQGMLAFAGGPVRVPARYAGRDLMVPASRALHWQRMGAVVRPPKRSQVAFRAPRVERHALRWEDGFGRQQHGVVSFGGGGRKQANWNGGGGGRKQQRAVTWNGGGGSRKHASWNGGGGGRKQQRAVTWNGGGSRRQASWNGGGGGRKQQRAVTWNGGGSRRQASWNGGGGGRKQQRAVTWNGGGSRRQASWNGGGGGRKQQRAVTWNGGGGHRQSFQANVGGGGSRRQANWGGGGGGHRQSFQGNFGGGGGRHGGGGGGGGRGHGGGGKHR